MGIGPKILFLHHQDKPAMATFACFSSIEIHLHRRDLPGVRRGTVGAEGRGALTAALHIFPTPPTLVSSGEMRITGVFKTFLSLHF